MQFSSRILVVVVALSLTGSGWMLKSAAAKPAPVQAAHPSLPSGVVVETIAPGSPAEMVGLRTGDVLQWCGARPLRSAFDFIAAWENASSPAITLKGLRANQPLTVQLPIQLPGMPSRDKEWDVRVRPQWPVAVQALYDGGQASFADGHTDEGVASWQNAIEALEKGGDATGAGWLCWRIGEMYRIKSEWKQGQQWQERAWKNVKSEGDVAAQTSVLRGLGEVRQSQGDLADALAEFEQAYKLDADNQNVFWEAQDLNCEVSIAFTRHDWKKALELNERARTLCRKQVSDSWQTVVALAGLGEIASAQSNYLQAQKDYEAALAIIPKQMHDSLIAAVIFNDIAIAAFNQGNLTKCIGYSQRVLVIFRREYPDSEAVMTVLSNMGQVARMQEDLIHARPDLEEALPLARKYKPDSNQLAAILLNLGVIASTSGNSPQAEVYMQKALDIRHKILPDTAQEAECNAQLGLLALQQGKSDDARRYAQTALAIYKKQKPYPVSMVVSLSTLGTLALIEGDIPQAKSYYKHALDICRSHGSPLFETATILGIMEKATTLQNALSNAQGYTQKSTILLRQTSNPSERAILLEDLSLAAVQHGHWKQARQYAEQLLAIRQHSFPASSSLIESYALLGYIEVQQGDHNNAQIHYQQMLDLTQKYCPDSLIEADMRGLQGHALLAKRDYEGALKQFDRAVNIVEARRGRIANPDNRAFLLEHHFVAFLGMMQAQIALNQKERAFETLERARARSLVDLLSEREQSATMPPLPDAPLDLVEKQQQINQQRSELSRNLLAAIANSSQTEADSLREQIKTLTAQQRELETTIRQTSSHYASLHYPKPLSFAEAQQTLDDGTLLLAYALGEKQSYVFAVTKTSIEVIALAIGEEALARDIKNLNRALQTKGSYQVLARHLYQQLVAPARKYIDASRRLLLCPDGVLNTLPFAALVTSAPDKPLQHLVEVRPLHVITSLSLYRELRQMPVSRADKILALADPDYGKDSAVASKHDASPTSLRLEAASGLHELRSQSRLQVPPSPSALRGKERAGVRYSGLHLEPLPETQGQIVALQKLYGTRVEAYVGKQATTAVIRQKGDQATILHLACHGLLDNAAPLSSALALSSDGADHGLLLASDILRLRLPADLVMLSACETGLGKQTQFEGVVGLTRAFQYAGAHTVGVSLWQVNVDSTTELMNRFYAEYKAGVSKDIALQRAQIAILHTPAWHDPYFWAAFQMVGDWK